MRTTDQLTHLLEQLTLEEKVSLLAGADLWYTIPIDRLGIPALKVTDGPNGARGEGFDGAVTSACFPVGVALGATWNNELVEQVGRALAQETKAKNAHILLAPTVNIHRTPLAGRNFECYSEDPYLASRLAVNFIRGLQSEHVGACVKHLVCNDQEFQRFSISAEVSTRALREIYLPVFQAAVQEAKVWAVMTAYNKLNSVYCSENHALLINLLKGEWGFDGLVISDWHGTYSPQAAWNGLDLEMPGPAHWMGADLLAAVQAGELFIEHIDDKVLRLLKTIQRCDVFDNLVSQPEKAINNPKHRALARRTAAEAIVLLKNEEGILPLQTDKLQKIAVIGANAKWPAIMGGGSSRVAPHYSISPLVGIQERAGDQVEISHEIGRLINKRLPLLDPNQLMSPEGREGILMVEYFANPNFHGEPVHTELISRSELSWYGYKIEHFDPANFSAQIRGIFTAATAGVYRFGLSSSGFSRAYFNEHLIIDRWKEKDVLDQSEAITKLELEAGESINLRIDYSWQSTERWRSVRFGCQTPLPDNLFASAIEKSASADVVVIFAGLTQEWESEGFDRPDMQLPCNQDDLIFSISEVNPNTIVVLNSGSPVNMPWLGQVKAVLQAWYGGQEAGHAIADILFGDVNPSGKLPMTFPIRVEDNPAFINYPGENGKVVYGEGIFVGYRYYETKKIAPLFPFGHGLSYTTFLYEKLKLNQSSYAVGEEIHISVQIQNSGTRSGQEIIQLYVRDPECRVARPEKELKRFTKVDLAPGERRIVTFNLNMVDLAFYDELKDAWVIEPGTFELFVGSSSQDIRLQSKFDVSGDEITIAGHSQHRS